MEKFFPCNLRISLMCTCVAHKKGQNILFYGLKFMLSGVVGMFLLYIFYVFLCLMYRRVWWQSNLKANFVHPYSSNSSENVCTWEFKELEIFCLFAGFQLTWPSLSLSAFDLNPSQILNMTSWVSSYLSLPGPHPRSSQIFWERVRENTTEKRGKSNKI